MRGKSYLESSTLDARSVLTRRDFQRRLMSTFITAVSADRFSIAAAAQIKGIDSHAHIFSRHLKMAPVHRYVPDYDAPLATYFALLKAHGITNAVLIQPSFLGTDNSFLVSAVKSHRDILRGVMVIDPAMDLRELDDLKHAGCAGIRLNLFGLPDLNLSSSQWARVLGKVKELDWQVEVHAEARRMPEIVKPLLQSGCNVVIDHFGRPDPALGVRDPGFQYLLSVADTRRVWMKISGAYRNGDSGVGQKVALDAIPLLKQSFGLERLVWGSDWPHTQFESKENYNEVFRFLQEMLPDEREREVVLTTSPAKLFGFPLALPTGDGKR